MTLLRGFSKVDGKRMIAIPSNIREKAGIMAGSMVEIKVIRIKGSNRWPHIIVHTSQVLPRLSMFQIVIKEEKSQIDDVARLILTDDTSNETRLESNYRVEIKLAGSYQNFWVVIYNRGPARLTTLQEKMRCLGKSGRNGNKWQIQKWEY